MCSAFSRVQSFRYGYVLCADPVMGVVGPTERVRPGSAFRDKGVPHGRDMRTLGSRPLLVDQATHHCSWDKSPSRLRLGSLRYLIIPCLKI